MKLYYFPLSTYSQKVLIALYEKELGFDPMLVDLRDEKEKTKYREIYPLGKIPVLFRDDGRMIPESTIIIEYLDTASDKGPDLIPEDPERARETRFKDRMTDLYLDDSVGSLVFESWKPEGQRNQELIERSNFRIEVMYEFMDKNMEGKTWAMGDEFTMADCAAAPPLLYAQDVAPFKDYANISRYWQRLQQRPSYQKVLGEVGPYLEELKAQTA